MEKIFGRRKEIRILETLLQSHEGELAAVYGRRRVGKTFLIRQFFQGKCDTFFELTGVHGARLAEQLRYFAIEVADVFHNGQPQPMPASWAEALTGLRQRVETTGGRGKIVLFFDEFPWLASPRSNFLSAFTHLWNRYLSQNPRVIVVICGSAASWMIQRVLKDRAGLHNRVRKILRLEPFTLSETEAYLKGRQINLERKQMVELYMAMGGIPYYLSQVERGQSATQAINETCFALQGMLRGEFGNLYRALFKNAELHEAIVRILAKNPGGLTRNELAHKVKMNSGGSLSNVLKELEESGFLLFTPPFGKTKKGGRYRLHDEYSLFYLRWIEPYQRRGSRQEDAQYWLKIRNSAKWASWAGVAFENICLKHIERLKIGLGIQSVITSESGWRYRANDSTEAGTQIDLVIDRADGCIHLCEVKFHNRPFTVTKDFHYKLIRRKAVFRDATQTTKSLFTTLITAYGIKPNAHFHSAVDAHLTLEVFFD